MSEQLFSKPSEYENSLSDIIDFLLESWKAIAISGVVGGLLAAGYSSVIPPKYQAKAYIEVAKVAGIEVEPPAQLEEKLKLPIYFSTESYSACNVVGQAEPGLVIVNQLKSRSVKATSMLNISYVGDSPEGAKKCLMSLINDIRTNQNLLAKTTLDSKKTQLAQLKLKLHSLERVFGAMPDDKSTFMAYVLLSKEAEIKDLRTQVNDLEFSLLAPQTKDALLAAPIYSPNQKVSPNRAKILTLGLIYGLFLGLLFMIGKRRWHAYKMSS
jgi:LPS O-antigen subunit length determinant protein (WzzB/FepE family)